MAMVEDAVLDGVGVIFTLGILAARSLMFDMPRCSIWSSVSTAIDIGVSWSDCIRFCAVTITSSSCAWADMQRGAMVSAATILSRKVPDTVSLPWAGYEFIRT